MKRKMPPGPGIEPGPPTWKSQTLTTWPPVQLDIYWSVCMSTVHLFTTIKVIILILHYIHYIKLYVSLCNDVGPICNLRINSYIPRKVLYLRFK